MADVTNGQIDREHYGLIGDAARSIASYCDGDARKHVYEAAFKALATAQTEAAELRAEVERLREALVLARNRLQRCAIDPIVEGKPYAYEWSLWADEVAQALAEGAQPHE